MENTPEQDPLKMVLAIFQQEKETDLAGRFGEKGLQIWRQANTRQRLVTPDIVGTVKGSCGDTISIALCINGETIVRTDFDTDGCASSQIAGATAAALAMNKTLDEAVDISDKDIIAAVGSFPAADSHCAYLAAAAVREAIHRWMIQHTHLLDATARSNAHDAKA